MGEYRQQQTQTYAQYDCFPHKLSHVETKVAETICEPLLAVHYWQRNPIFPMGFPLALPYPAEQKHSLINRMNTAFS
jgi:hypothetical protein